MKITNGSSITKPVTAPATSGAGAKGAPAPSTVAGTASNTATAVVDPATRLSQLEAQFSQADFNASKVGEVTDAIQSGKYQVNAGAVADKLLENAAALGRKSGGNS